MNIGCYLISTEGKLEKAFLPEGLLVDLSKSLRSNGVEAVHFEGKDSILVEGLYIPAKGTKMSIIALPDVGE